MNQHDFFKFLQQNNLNDVLDTAIEYSQNFNLPQTIGLLGKKEENIFNAADLFRKKRDLIQFNCEFELDGDEVTLPITINANTTLLSNQAKLSKLETVDSEDGLLHVTTPEKKYALLQYSIQTGSLEPTTSFKPYSHLSLFKTWNIPNGVIFEPKTSYITWDNAPLAEEVYFADKWYNTINPNDKHLLDTFNTFIYDKEFFNNQSYRMTNIFSRLEGYTYIAIFIDLTKNKAYFAKINETTGTLTIGNTYEGITANELEDKKIAINMGFKMNEDSYRLTHELRIRFTFFNTISPLAEKWLKTIPITI